jgi:NADH dehydrogenase
MTRISATPSAPLPHVLVIGGGFGGLYCVRELADAAVRITLIDRRNHHLFQPLLYQVATAALDPSDIASPLRQIFAEQENVTVLLGDAERVIPERRVVIVDGREVSYDALVLATGVTHTYFGHDEYEAVAPGLKTLSDALGIRGRIFSAFEEAERCEDAAARRRLTTFVIVGGGPTGVELAGALAEIATETLPGEFRHIDPKHTRILLVEAQPHILGSYPERLQLSAEDQLRRLGVELRLGARVERIDAESCVVDGERIATNTVLWAAGVRGSPLATTLGAPLDRAGRVVVLPIYRCPVIRRSSWSAISRP